MRPRGQQHSYRNLDGLNAGRDAVPWYWRAVAGVAVLMILGGFLMLPATFDSDPLLRVAKSVIGIFAVALLTAGFSLTGLLAFAVRNPLFRADAVYLPSLTSCALGLLTIFYDFLISSRFSWTTPALLLTIAAAVSTVIYGGLLIWTYRKISSIRSSTPANHPLDMRPSSLQSDLAGTHYNTANQAYQPQGYYENYVRNMYPASTHVQTPPANAVGGYDPNSLTEEEMQRQQMLMLLLTREQAPTPDPTQSTFHIDWQGGQEPDEYHRLQQHQPPGTPVGGYYAPTSTSSQPGSAFPNSAFPLQSALSGSVYSPRPGTGGRQWTQDHMKPWDGIMRGVATQRRSREEMEMGMGYR